MKLRLTIGLMLLCSVSFAQGGRIALLDKVPSHRVTFDYTYSVSKDGAAFSEVTDGSVLIQDNCFSMTGLGLKVVSDGKTRWSVDESAGEVLIETVDKEDVFTNPALFIASYTNYGDLITVRKATSDSLDAEVILDDNMLARFVLKNVRFYDKSDDKKDFTMEGKSFDGSYVITDLR